MRKELGRQEEQQWTEPLATDHAPDARQNHSCLSRAESLGSLAPPHSQGAFQALTHDQLQSCRLHALQAGLLVDARPNNKPAPVEARIGRTTGNRRGGAEGRATAVSAVRGQLARGERTAALMRQAF